MGLDAVLDLAVRTGFTGLETRCAAGEPIHPDLTGPERTAVAAAFRRYDVAPVGLAS